MPRRTSTLECKRSVLSCSRCRKRKTKCDRKLPACCQCVSSGSPCKGFNSAHDAQIPRSLAQHLEEEVARLEKELADLGYPNSDMVATTLSDVTEQEANIPLDKTCPTSGSQSIPHGSSHATTSAIDVTKESIINSAELQAMISATMPQGPSLTDVVRRVRMGLTPSLVFSPTANDQAQSKAPIQNQNNDLEVDIPILSSLPHHVIHTLVKKYVQRMLPIHPFLYEPTVWQQLDRVLRKIPEQCGVSGEVPLTVKLDYDFLVIYLILSVSATLGSAKVGHAARCMAFSESLFKEGIRHLSQTAAYPSDMAWIQVTLLILQYASINPKLGNVWILSGFAMRNCLELGLHREVSESMGLDQLTIDLRRRIFWAAYCMDRSICAALQRPLSIPDPAIDTSVMSVLEDCCITPLGLDHGGQSTKELAIRWIEYRQLQSNMIEVHFQGRPLDPGQHWEDWLTVTEQKLWAWYESDLPHDGWTEFALMHGLVTLHRPSPRVPIPASRSLSSAFEAACSSAKSCREQIVSGYFPRPWLAAHHTFETALVALFCLRHSYDNISQQFSPGEIFEMTKLFTSNLLTISSQGWSEVSEYAGIYERLLGPLLDAVLTRTKPVSLAHTPEQDAELLRLLYPSPAHPKELRFAGPAIEFDENYSPFDATIFDWDDDSLGNEDRTLSMMLF